MRRHLFASVLVIAACGGSPQPIKEVTTLPSASASVAPPPAVDLSAVPMPQAVVALVHVSHVRASRDMLSDWAGQPLDADQALAEMIGERLAKLVDLDAAADMTFTVEDRGGHRDPEVRVGVALAVSDFDAAKAQLQGEYGLLSIGNGAFEIKRSGAHRHEGDSDFRSCALAPAKNGGRVVCSHDATSRDAVLPFLTRGTGNLSAIKSDLHVDARPGPLREILRRERTNLTQTGARFLGRDLRTLSEPILGDMADAFLDVERASLDATLDTKEGSVDFKITTKGSQGLITRILSSHPDRAEPPPASFLRLPADADLALFEHGLDADQIAAPRSELVTWLDAGLATEQNLSPSDRKAVVDAFTHTLDLGTMPIVYARGVDFSKAIPAVAGLTETSDGAKIRAGAEQAAGWEIFGVESAPEKITALFKEWVAAISRPTFAQRAHDVKWRVAAASRNAPPGSIHFAFSFEHDDTDWQTRLANGQYKKRPPITLTLHTLLVPDGARAWIVNALDEATAANKARQILANATATTGTLATRPGLDTLRSARVNGGGFFTTRGVGLGLPLTYLTHSNLRYTLSNDPLVGVSSQSQYTTPILFFGTEAAHNDEKTVTFSMRVTRGVVADALAVAPHIFH